MNLVHGEVAGGVKGKGREETLCPETRMQRQKIMNLNPWPIMCNLLSFKLVRSGYIMVEKGGHCFTCSKTVKNMKIRTG